MPPNREAIMQICSAYLEATKAQDASRARLALDVVLTENGHIAAQGRDGVHRIWQSTERPLVKDIKIKRWMIEGDEAVVMYERHRADGRVAQASEYFRVDGGMIKEINANFGLFPTDQELARYIEQLPDYSS